MAPWVDIEEIQTSGKPASLNRRPQVEGYREGFVQDVRLFSLQRSGHDDAAIVFCQRIEMAPTWHGLLGSFGVVAIFIMGWTYVRDYLGDAKSVLTQATFGLHMGVCTVLLLITAFHLTPGMIFDIRSTPLGLAGFFGGPIAGVIAGCIGFAYRLSLSGQGMESGLLSIVVSATIGIIGHRLLNGRLATPKHVFFFGVALAIGWYSGFLLLPKEVAMAAIAKVGVPAFCLIVASTALGGFALAQDDRRRALDRANAIYRAAIEALPDCLSVKDRAGLFLASNPATARFMRAGGVDNLIGKTDADFYAPETAAGFAAMERHVVESARAVTIEESVVHRDGSQAWLSTLKSPMFDKDGVVIGTVTHNRDITDRKTLEADLARTQAHFREALSHMADALVMFDAEARLVLCNQQYRDLFPLTADVRVPGADLRSILRTCLERGEQVLPAHQSAEAWIAELCSALGQTGDRLIQLEDGRWIEARTRRVTDGGSLIVFADVTERKAAEEALAEMNRHLVALAATDSLTGLTNRRGFDQALERELRRSQREGLPLALLLIDVDRFKAYNDTYGHQAGDEALRRVGAAVQGILRRPGDLAARYGGEELACILPNTTAEGAEQVAQTIRLAIRDLAVEHGQSEAGLVTVSIGVSVTGRTQPIREAHDLLRLADAALYRAKAAGRDCVMIDAAPHDLSAMRA